MPFCTLFSQFQTIEVITTTITSPTRSSPPNQGQKPAGCFFVSGAGRLPVVAGAICSSGFKGASDNCLDMRYVFPPDYSLVLVEQQPIFLCFYSQTKNLPYSI